MLSTGVPPGRRSPLVHRAARTAQNVAVVLVTLALVEILLQAAAAMSRPLRIFLTPGWQRSEMLLPDPELAYRGNVLKPDHDVNGYRNRRALDRADVVALGDSHTYGVSVAREAAWPSVLSTRTGLGVYNMSVAGYGPAHSLVQLKRALALQPRVIVVGLYFGNDFYDSFALTKVNPRIAALVPPVLAQQSAAAESKQPLEEQLDMLYRIGNKARDAAESERPEPPLLRRLMSEHSKLYALLRALASHLSTTGDVPGLLRKDFDLAVGSLSPEDLQICSVFDDGAWKTILTAPYRLRSLDVQDPRIRAGVEVTLRALEEIRDETQQSGAELLVVLLPTKEYVFATRTLDMSGHVGFEALVRAEDDLHREVISFLSSRNITFVDPLPALRGSAQQPFFEDADGHPNEHGHELIANLVADAIGGHGPAK